MRFNFNEMQNVTCGSLKQLTKEIRAEKDLSKILKDQNEKEKRAKINKEISEIIAGNW